MTEYTKIEENKQLLLNRIGEEGIKAFLYKIDTDADHEENEIERKRLSEMFKFLMSVFPECDPYSNG